MQLLEEQSRLGALDDPVVVGGADGDDLGHAEVGQCALIGPLILRRVVDGAYTDDGALPGHQPGHRLDGADRPRVGQRDGGPGEVIR